MTTVTEKLATWGAGAGSLPDAVVHHAKRAAIDWYTAAAVGVPLPPARALVGALVDEGCRGPAAIVASEHRVPLRVAALVNATSAHTAEVDDIFRDGVYHPGAPTIAAALAAAQTTDASGPDLVRGIVVGFEIGTRIATAIQPAHYRYWHTTGTVGTMGAAAAVGVILDLDAERLAHALATSVTVAAGLQQAFRSDAMSKPLHAGHAAEAGALAALGAAHGLTGALDVLEGDAGFGNAMSECPDWSVATAGLGDTWNVTRITFKNHSACGHTFAAIDAALTLRERHNLADADVRRIVVETYGTAKEVAGNVDPTTAFEAKFSLPYCVAAALRLGSVRLRAFEDDRLRDEMLRALMARTEVTVDPELDAGFPGRRAARVVIEAADGARYEELAPTRKGDPDHPLTDDDLRAKYQEMVVPVIGAADAATVADALWSLEEQLSMRALPLGLALPLSERPRGGYPAEQRPWPERPGGAAARSRK